MDTVLVLPPTWYYAAVPADLSYVVGTLRAAGWTATALDLSMGFTHSVLGHHPAWAALRNPQTYTDRATQLAAHRALYQAMASRSAQSPADWGLRHLHLGGVDEGDAAAGRVAALDPRRNPALPYLRRHAHQLAEQAPRWVAIALVHPDQRPQALAFASLLREAGYSGRIALYGSLEDVIAPLDFAPDLIGQPTHVVFDHIDVVVVGEASSALCALLADASAPNVVRPGDTQLPPLIQEDLAATAVPAFDWVRPEIYPFPTPVVDLAFGRGCPYGRCAFCAIQAHQPGYRFSSAAAIGASMSAAHDALGSSFFRVRDPLVSPVHLTAIGDVVRSLGWPACWVARARFTPALTRERLSAHGLTELWLGLESAVPRVRDLMDKGVSQPIVERVLTDSAAIGLRLRALCLLGFPGETEAEAQQTIAFLAREQHRLAGLSLTPFELMRRSPMATDPARWALTVSEDPVPRHQRLRHTLPVADSPGLDGRRAVSIKAEAVSRFASILQRDPGPWPSHTWIGASTRS